MVEDLVKRMRHHAAKTSLVDRLLLLEAVRMIEGMDKAIKFWEAAEGVYIYPPKESRHD